VTGFWEAHDVAPSRSLPASRTAGSQDESPCGAIHKFNDERDGETPPLQSQPVWLGDGLGDSFFPAALGFQDQLDQFADGAFAAANCGDVVGGAFYFVDGVGDCNGQAYALEDREVREVVADVGYFFVAYSGADQDGLVGF
jgi:hypothetical protein